MSKKLRHIRAVLKYYFELELGYKGIKGDVWGFYKGDSLTSRGDTVKKYAYFMIKVVLKSLVAIIMVFLSWLSLNTEIGTSFIIFFYSVVFIVFLMTLRIIDKNKYNFKYEMVGPLNICNHDLIKNKPLSNCPDMSKKLTHAIKNELIDIHFQKIINTKDDSILYLEQLARWNDKDLGCINPDSFIEIAKQNNQLLDLEFYLINKALESFDNYYKNHSQVKLSINLTPEAFLNKQTIKYINSTLKHYNMSPKNVCIEVSENLFVYDLSLCKKQISSFKDYGFEIALDDFGKSYSSLGILEAIDYDVIKIDRLFTKTIHKDQTKEIIKMVQKISNMAYKTIVIEGVETNEQKALLEKLNCYNMQGYLLHKPESIKAINPH